MTATNETLSMATEAQLKRDLPQSIVIPPIRGEMVHLRPATVEDLPRLDELDAFYGASKITGKDAVTERAIVHTWVRRSQAWEAGQAPAESGVGDPESRRTIAWAVLTDADHDEDGEIDAQSTDNVIGMIFLIDIDGWSRSARIQVVLGKDYRGRGYSRDAMPRVMTFGFAPRPAGLGMHRIWVAVPEKNTVKVVEDGCVTATPDRAKLWAVQTPQGFRREILCAAYAQAAADGFLGTDDASLVERLGRPVHVVMSDYRNLKVTTPEDLVMAEALLKAPES